MSAPPVSSPAASAQDGGDTERALDALAGVLRTLGRYAIDQTDAPADKVAELAEAWALHLLILKPRPTDPQGGKARQRDFPGVVQFATALRKSEQAFVTRALTELREAVWMFIETLNRALVDEEASDADVTSTITTLRRVAETGSAEELRRVAASTASTVTEIVRARKARQMDRNLEIGERLARLDAQLEEAKRDRDLDALTGLNNRGAFDQFVKHLVAIRALKRSPSSLLLLDVDHFKHINDTYGHPIGDEVLRCLGACLTRTILRKQDFLARYGGEEFAVVLPETELRDAAKLAERVRVAVARITIAEARELRVTASIGVASLEQGDDVTAFIARADRALYEAKRLGRDRVEIAG